MDRRPFLLHERFCFCTLNVVIHNGSVHTCGAVAGTCIVLALGRGFETWSSYSFWINYRSSWEVGPIGGWLFLHKKKKKQGFCAITRPCVIDSGPCHAGVDGYTRVRGGWLYLNGLTSLVTTNTYFVTLCTKVTVACKFYDPWCIYLFHKHARRRFFLFLMRHNIP